MGHSNYIKLLAVFFMALDHIGAFLFPEVLWLRIIGRFAFPLFAQQIVEGFIYSRNIESYSLRLFFLASIWQLFYAYFIYLGDFSSSAPLNVIFTLLYGLICIKLYDSKQWYFLTFALISSFCADFFQVGFQYGTYGVLFILGFYYFSSYYFIFAYFWILSALVVGVGIYPSIQMFAPFAVFFVALPLSVSFRPGRFFYWFYPGHLLFLMFLKRLPL